MYCKESPMPENPKRHCLTDMEARILSQDILPGSDLDEAGLCARYGISRTPLREVLQRLAGDGYVVLADNRGAKVASMDLAVMRVFFQTAPLVYSTIARLAAENRSAAQLEALRATQQRFARAAVSGQATQMALLNHAFHAQIGEMAQNPYLMASLRRMLIDHTRLSQTFFRPSTQDDAQRVAKAVEQHDAMIAAIAAQEPSLAIDLTLQHWDLSRDRMERYVRPDPLPLNVAEMMDGRHAV
jgi:DNA-binding GntR family transcriptional regulator